MARVRVVVIGLFVCFSLLLSAGCWAQVGISIATSSGDKEYIAVFNRVDELLIGDLGDSVSLKELESKYAGKEIIGLGTTAREHCGELIFSSENCYWADPTNQGRIVELDWSEEKLPFCAIVRVDRVVGSTFNGVNGDLHAYLEGKAKELGMPLAAVRAKGRFNGVKLSIADRLPANADEKVQWIVVTVDDGREWEFVGFYALTKDGQEMISIEEHPVHLHGMTGDGSHGGHLVHANTVDAEVTIYPVGQYILRNRVPR
ncbi:MAG: acetolactate decarboxylase [Chloroflexi bacterium]|nr:acetolactate decarboxylase [Chloroflexota bacterium]MBM3154224.1 acetolactate decarboxylase [Chloroflexota bacterium]MBM3172331.1 acetolactate decarboxylase [Chloroflexota bacterium]MBM3175042.1 acetolactate decarboxylase [Chloroflexota bacterium]MBM4449913.1 acetolactate decarboxylase [Chloroflexota bacterium]